VFYVGCLTGGQGQTTLPMGASRPPTRLLMKKAVQRGANPCGPPAHPLWREIGPPKGGPTTKQKECSNGRERHSSAPLSRLGDHPLDTGDLRSRLKEGDPRRLPAAGITSLTAPSIVNGKKLRLSLCPKLFARSPSPSTRQPPSPSGVMRESSQKPTLRAVARSCCQASPLDNRVEQQKSRDFSV